MIIDKNKKNIYNKIKEVRMFNEKNNSTYSCHFPSYIYKL